MRSHRRIGGASFMLALSAAIGCPATDAPPSATRGSPEAEVPASTRPADAPASRPDENGPAAARVEALDARARAMPPAAGNSAAFMTLRNPGPTAAIVEAKADVSETVELHTHTRVDGVMKMRRVPKIELPAGEDTVLEPGGLHVMLIGLTEPLKAGERFDLTLVFEDGSQKTVEVEVRAIEAPHASP
jgi:hypothetical protein